MREKPLDIFVDETEWWDRIAVGVELLEKKPKIHRRRIKLSGKIVHCVGDLVPGEETADPENTTAYVFADLADTEILRRLTQMPDETPLDLLRRPTAVYCAENRSFVSVNDSSRTLEEHLRNLERGQS